MSMTNFRAEDMPGANNNKKAVKKPIAPVAKPKVAPKAVEEAVETEATEATEAE